ncbi:hypothetical protein GCM10022240_14910 [Microbacterium kribbense]|uniref:Glycosyltransferase n=1 Tax=Microbacterium kribbense TaxID=433645 RepID=A0ABP7GGB8_9MICO
MVVEAWKPVMEAGASDLLLFGSPVFHEGMERLLHEIHDAIQAESPYLVMTINVDMALEIIDNTAFRQIYRSCDIRLLDGMPLVMLARAIGKPASRNTGSDLLPRAVEYGSRLGWRIVIAGGRDGVSAAAARHLTEQFPSSHVSAIPFPDVTSVDDLASERFVSALAKGKPDLVFLCLGAPKQERWFAHWKAKLPPAVYVGAGAAVDFAAGEKLRAPKLVQRIGLEWMWRLALEPRRLSFRYLVRGPRFGRVILETMWNRVCH